SQIEVQIPDRLPDHRDLLRILLAEVCDVGFDDVEEFEADGGDAVEVAGPEVPLETERGPLHDDGGGIPGGVDLVDRGEEDRVDSRGCGYLEVARFLARIGRKVRRVVELSRVDKNGRDDMAAL